MPGPYSDLRYHSLVVVPDGTRGKLDVTESILTVKRTWLLASFLGASAPWAVGR